MLPDLQLGHTDAGRQRAAHDVLAVYQCQRGQRSARLERPRPGATSHGPDRHLPVTQQTVRSKSTNVTEYKMLTS